MQIAKSGAESSFGRGRFFAFMRAKSHVCKLPANFKLSSDSEENSEDVRILLLTVSFLKMCDFVRGQIVSNILNCPRVRIKTVCRARSERRSSTEAHHRVFSSISRLSKHHVVPADVSDAKDPVR